MKRKKYACLLNQFKILPLPVDIGEMAFQQGELIDRCHLISLRDAIRSFAQRECEAIREQYSRLWSLPLPERMERGRCISNLYLERIFDNRIARFRCEINNADFREGDRVRLSLGDPRIAVAEGEFYREELQFVEIRLDGSWIKDCNSGDRFTLDHSFFDLESSFLKAIDRLGETDIGRRRILPLLGGELDSRINAEEYEQTADAGTLRGLNDGQAEAVAAASTTDLCRLIQGPPGTGKTYVLAEVVRNRLEKGERILVTSFTHRAIHNALNKIVECAPEASICKIGRPFFDTSLKVQQFELFEYCSFARSGGAYVVGATPFTAQGRLKDVEFDTVIFDEAGQVTLPLAIMGMLSGRTYIFVGDDKQLPPIIHSAVNKDEARSIFSYLKGRGLEDVLNVTYRMNKEITHWPSEQFYYGELKSHESVACRRISYPRSSSEHEEILNPAHPVVFIESLEGSDRTSSHEQAIIIGELVKELVKTRGIPGSQIGVVVPFRKQARLIRQRLQDRGRPDAGYADLVVDTVERMQGQEREVIIVGLTASDPDFITKVYPFLFQENRLNVCFSRARSKLIVIGSTTLLHAVDQFEGPDLKAARQLLKSFVSSAKHVRWK